MKVVTIIIATFAMTVTPAHSEGAPRVDKNNLDDVRLYSKCTVRNFHDRVQKLILSHIDNKTMERKFGDIFPSAALAYVANCEELNLRFRSINVDPDTFRASVADFLVKKDFGQDVVVDFTDVTPLVHVSIESDDAYQTKLRSAKTETRRTALKTEHDQNVSRQWLSVYGECVARNDTITTRDFLMSMPGTTSELSVISKMKPALGACLVEGEKLSFDRNMIRGTLATNYYRLAMAKRASSIGRLQ